MSTPATHTITCDSTPYHYLSFDNAGHFHRFVQKEAARLDPHHQGVMRHMHVTTQRNIDNSSDWYGTPPPASIEALAAHTLYSGMHLLDAVHQKIQAWLQEYLAYVDREIMPKPGLAYNDRGLGIFSFDRAAMGLFPQIPVNTRTPLDVTNTQLHIELDDTCIRTSVKKTFAWFSDKKVLKPALRLYVMAGGNAGVSGEGLLYPGLACAILADFLQQRGVAVALHVILGSAFNNQAYLAIIRVKRFQDALDKNMLLLLASDPRYFRYNGFRGLICLSNHFKGNIPTGLGSLHEKMGNTFIGNLAKKDNTKRYLFEQSYSLEAATQEVKSILHQYNQHTKHE